MNENDLREAMRASMTLTPPPPMPSAAALTAGRRAVRRRATLAGAGATALALVAAALVVNPDLRPTSGGGDSPWAGLAAPWADENTEPAWPLDGDGKPQEDATARSGERYEKGRTLLDELLTVVPDGWDTPSGKPADEGPLQYHQAQVEGDNTGSTWSYLARAAVARSGRTGQLLAEVHTTNNGLPADPCALAATFRSQEGDCEVITVGGAEVGVADVTPGEDEIDQWAAYRHPDGVVVFVAQSRHANAAGTLKPLEDLPLTKPELAALAVDDRFHLN